MTFEIAAAPSASPEPKLSEEMLYCWSAEAPVWRGSGLKVIVDRSCRFSRDSKASQRRRKRARSEAMRAQGGTHGGGLKVFGSRPG